jgi:hypothetical protein
MRVDSVHLMNKVEDGTMKAYLLSLLTKTILDATDQR